METHFAFVGQFEAEDLAPLVEAHASTLRSAKEEAIEAIGEIEEAQRAATIRHGVG